MVPKDGGAQFIGCYEAAILDVLCADSDSDIDCSYDDSK
jgi:hypothetical protein